MKMGTAEKCFSIGQKIISLHPLSLTSVTVLFSLSYDIILTFDIYFCPFQGGGTDPPLVHAQGRPCL